MKVHSNFFRVEAKDNFELGTILGKKFGGFARQKIDENSRQSDWLIRLERAKKYLDITERYFPEYVEELRGYAEGAEVDFLSIWTLSLEDETYEELRGKCTTIVTNKGKLIAHNEDWAKDSENNICLLHKKVGDNTTILELYYFNTLGGNAISINSHGFTVSINSLTHTDAKLGMPRNVITRFLSETKDPEKDFLKLKNFPRGLGSNFNIINQEGKIWNIESGGVSVTIALPQTPYVHTNHYLGELKYLEKSDNWDGTFDRYEVARVKVKDKMTIEEIVDLTNDRSREKASIMNERTIAKMVVDLEKKVVHVWMKREEDLGWVEYRLSELLW
jgi:hypothetical protein